MSSIRANFGLLVIASVWIVAALVFPSRPLDIVEVGVDSTPGLPVDTDVASPGSAPSTDPDPTQSSQSTQPPSQRPGTAAADTGTAPGPSAVAHVGQGVTKGGVECAPGVLQVPQSSYALPCVAAFSGNNGGATARGVTGDTIRVVRRVFEGDSNSQAVDQAVAQAGGADKATVHRNRDELIEYLEQHVELYGRKVEWIDYESRFGNPTAEAQGRGREEACLDAEVVAEELNAFAVVGDDLPFGVSQVFAECAAERGLVVLNGAAYANEVFLDRHHPYVWSFFPDCERVAHHTHEYMKKRLAFRPVTWSGDPDYVGEDRVFGVYAPDVDDLLCFNLMKNMNAEAGFPFESMYFYTLDVARFADEASRAVIQFKRDGVTSLVLACDPISASFLTQAATNQDWHPEWILIGAALTDTDGGARLYDQREVDGHLFGMSALGRRSDEPNRVYRAATGSDLPEGSDGNYPLLMLYYNLLMAGGPSLTPQSIAQGIQQAPIMGAPEFPYGAWYFGDGPDGTVGEGDHTAIEDHREVYWLANGLGPDGKPGTYATTYGGSRFNLGEWPAEPPPVYP